MYGKKTWYNFIFHSPNVSLFAQLPFMQHPLKKGEEKGYIMPQLLS
jgi:hypothetical protein